VGAFSSTTRSPTLATAFPALKASNNVAIVVILVMFIILLLHRFSRADEIM